jgi:hypothetical protein
MVVRDQQGIPAGEVEEDPAAGEEAAEHLDDEAAVEPPSDRLHRSAPQYVPVAPLNYLV